MRMKSVFLIWDLVSLKNNCSRKAKSLNIPFNKLFHIAESKKVLAYTEKIAKDQLIFTNKSWRNSQIIRRFNTKRILTNTFKWLVITSNDKYQFMDNECLTNMQLNLNERVYIFVNDYCVFIGI